MTRFEDYRSYHMKVTYESRPLFPSSNRFKHRPEKSRLPPNLRSVKTPRGQDPQLLIPRSSASPLGSTASTRISSALPGSSDGRGAEVSWRPSGRKAVKNIKRSPDSCRWDGVYNAGGFFAA